MAVKLSCLDDAGDVCRARWMIVASSVLFG